MPVVFLLLFVYVFGGTMGAGLPGGDRQIGPRADYLHYITPAILVMTVAVGGQQHRDPVAKDATEGIIDRFRTMPIARSRAADRPRAGRDGADGPRACSSSSAIALGARLPRRRLGGRVAAGAGHDRC